MPLPQVGSAWCSSSRHLQQGGFADSPFPAWHLLLGIPVPGEMLTPWDLKLLCVFENQGFFPPPLLGPHWQSLHSLLNSSPESLVQKGITEQT